MPKGPMDRLKNVILNCGARREDVEDIAQEVALRMRMRECVGQGDVVNNEEAFTTRIAVNLVVDASRVHARTSAREVPIEDTVLVDPAPQPDEECDVELCLEKVVKALEDRGPNICHAFWLHRIQGNSHREIASELSVSVSMVEKYIAAATTVLAGERHQFE